MQRIIEMKHAAAEDVARKLNEIFLKKTGEMMLSLRRGEEAQVGPLRVRVVSVNAKDPENLKDDETVLSVSSETTVDQFTVREGGRHAVKIFDTEVQSISPASTGKGDGSIRLLVRDRAGVANPQQPVEQGIEFNPIGELNVIVIRYTEEDYYSEAMDLIKQMDQPAKLVQMEFQFVILTAEASKRWREPKGPVGDWSNLFEKMRAAGEAEAWTGRKVAAIAGKQAEFGIEPLADWEVAAEAVSHRFRVTPRVQSASSITLDDLSIELIVTDPTRKIDGKPLAYRKKVVTDARVASGDQYLIDWTDPKQPAFDGENGSSEKLSDDALDSMRAMNAFFAHPERRRFIVLTTNLVE